MDGDYLYYKAEKSVEAMEYISANNPDVINSLKRDAHNYKK